MHTPTNTVLTATASVLLLIASGGCGDSAHEGAAAPEQSAATPAPGSASPASPPLAPTAPPATTGDARPWTAPESWRAVPGERPMRLATYEIPDTNGPVEVAITRFPGDVGGMLANVNRWRGQIGLAPLSEADLPALLEHFENPGFVGAFMHLKGPQQHMLAASIHEPAASRTWFVRVTTTPDVAERVKPQVEAFARTFSAGG